MCGARYKEGMIYFFKKRIGPFNRLFECFEEITSYSVTSYLCRTQVSKKELHLNLKMPRQAIPNTVNPFSFENSGYSLRHMS